MFIKAVTVPTPRRIKKYLKDNKSFLSDKARWEIIDNEFAKESTEK